ncbi:14813_t:CDS:2 [Rhizophagus irregularis]|nr:14813_t:CDS:2 [Rhizophagus irregularis]
MSSYVIDINNEKQRSLILNICFQILSFPYQEETESLLLGFFEFSSHDDVTKLLQKVFGENGIIIMCHVTKANSKMEFYVNYDKTLLERIMPIIKDWYKPFVNELQNQHNVKVKEWKENYDIDHSEDILRNRIIDNINDLLPGFNYFVDFKWRIYLVIETKWLNNNHGDKAKKARIDGINDVKERTLKYKELAKKRFNDIVIGISYTNEKGKDPIHFVDITDEKIFNAIKSNKNKKIKKNESSFDPGLMGFMAGTTITAAGMAGIGILLRK